MKEMERQRLKSLALWYNNSPNTFKHSIHLCPFDGRSNHYQKNRFSIQVAENSFSKWGKGPTVGKSPPTKIIFIGGKSIFTGSRTTCLKKIYVVDKINPHPSVLPSLPAAQHSTAAALSLSRWRRHTSVTCAAALLRLDLGEREGRHLRRCQRPSSSLRRIWEEELPLSKIDTTPPPSLPSGRIWERGEGRRLRCSRTSSDRPPQPLRAVADAAPTARPSRSRRCSTSSLHFSYAVIWLRGSYPLRKKTPSLRKCFF